MIGYKVLNKDWRGKQWGAPITKLPGFHYNLGHTYIETVTGTEITIDTDKCVRGFHFCDRMADAIRFAPIVAGISPEECDLHNFVFTEVVAGGSISMKTVAGVRTWRSSIIKIVREFSFEEAMELARTEIEEGK